MNISKNMGSMGKLSANVRKLLLIQMVWGVQFYSGTYSLFFQHYGLTESSLFAIESLFAIVMVLGSFPIGFLSDKYSKKGFIILGMVLCGVGYGLFFLGDVFRMFAL